MAEASERIILGIDPGTQITGYGIIRCKGKKMEMMVCGVIRLDRGPKTHAEKLSQIYHRVGGIIREFSPTEMALEAPFFGKNVQSMLKLGRAQGVAMAAGLSQGLEIFEYAPKKIKVAVTGRGTASKEQVHGMLQKLLNTKIEPLKLDATDGLAVAVCHFFQGSTVTKGKSYKNWGSFIKDNPDRLK